MSLRMGAKQTDKYFIVGLDKDGNGVPLEAGQTCTVTSADQNAVAVTPDTPSLPTDADYRLADGTAVPKGTVTQGSGTVAFGPGAKASVPVVVTSHLANADGSPILDELGAPIGDKSDTVTLAPNLVAKEGELFGTPV